MKDISGWSPIDEAPKDGSYQLVYTSACDGLPPFISECSWHPDAGWCTDELRVVTHYLPSAKGALESSYLRGKGSL